MPRHVQTGGCKVFAQSVCRLESDALQHALLQFGGHRLARFAMEGVVVEDFGDGGKRLIELRRHLNEVASHRCSAQTIVVAVGEYAVQGMAELMKQRGHLVPRH